MPSTDSSSDDAALAAHAEALRAGLTERLPTWAERTLAERLGSELTPEHAEFLRAAVADVLEQIGDLLDTDIDAQTANPLAIVRTLVTPMAHVLDEAGVRRPNRDADAIRIFPDDVHDLAPGAFSDIHPDLHLPGLTWGAAKAHVHLRRRRAEGLIP